MIPKLVSAEEYSRISGMGVEEVKRQCRLGKIDHFRTEKRILQNKSVRH